MSGAVRRRQSSAEEAGTQGTPGEHATEENFIPRRKVSSGQGARRQREGVRPSHQLNGKRVHSLIRRGRISRLLYNCTFHSLPPPLPLPNRPQRSWYPSRMARLAATISYCCLLPLPVTVIHPYNHKRTRLPTHPPTHSPTLSDVPHRHPPTISK